MKNLITDTIHGPIIGMKVRWWVDEGLYPCTTRRAASRYPSENPWEHDHAKMYTGSHYLIEGKRVADTMRVHHKEGIILGCTKDYVVVSCEHRLISIAWGYLRTKCTHS